MTDDRIFAGVITALGLLIGGLLFFMFRYELQRDASARPMQEARAKLWLEAEAQAIKNCIAKGGSPVQSSWDGRFKDCK